MPLPTDTLSELGAEVPLSSVGRELKKLFSSDKAVTRASLINFAIYSEQPDSLSANTELIREVTREHACRALLVAVTQCDQAPQVRAWVTAHCNLSSGGGKSICSEQITLLMEGRSAYFVPNTVLSHLDSDLPLVFWWQGELSENFEPTLYSRIDRLIIDSGEWSHPAAQFELLEDAYSSSPSRFNVMDLTWTRILQMRLALAACYDDPLALAELPRVHEVVITHAATHALDARMIAAWMAEKAGWKWLPPMQGNRTELTLESKEGVRIMLRFIAHGGPTSIASIKLTSPLITCEVLRDPSSSFICSRLTTRDQTIEHLTPATLNTPAELIIERLRRGCNNRLYFTLLQTVRQLVAD